MAQIHKVATLVAQALIVACAGCAEGEDVSFEEDVRPSMSRQLEPLIAVAADPDIGASMDLLVEQATQDVDATYSPTVADCFVHHYERDGIMIAIYEQCTGSHRKLSAYEAVPELGAYAARLVRVFGDLNDDGSVDAWFDPDRGGLFLEDRDHDGTVDRYSESFERLGADFSIEGYDETWIPPAYPDERILEDTDFDRLYDRETITAGKDPNGTMSYWRKR